MRPDDLVLPEVSDAEIDRLVSTMSSTGHASLPGFLNAELIAGARAFIVDELARHKGEYFSHIGRDAVQGSLLAALGDSPAFRGILGRIYQRAFGKAPAGDLYQVLRVLAGRTGLDQAFQFHYDAYVVTALVPIVIPSGAGEQRGDLILYPNLRSVRSSVVINALEKAVLQNPVMRRAMTSPLAQRLLGARRLPLEPGNVYFFWGYRTLHANEPCLPDSLRATGLFHLVDPHEGSPLTRMVQARRRRKEARIRQRASR